MRRWLRGFALGGLVVACTGTERPPGYLVLAINTGDLMLPKDTGLVGLYLTQIDASGKMTALPPIERAITTDEAGNPTVRFPGTLVVESSGKEARLRSRLVAYDRDTRNVLTMRESRAAVPTDGGALLRLHLFLTNQGNVKDSMPGQPVTTASRADELRVQQRAEGDLDPYARFASVCDGALAPDGRTAGDDGRCVELDVATEPLTAGAPLPGSDANEFCYDVALTFERRADDAVPLVELRDLPESGECRIELPRAFEATRLNVALVSADGLPSKDYAGLRPLAAGLAFVQEGNVLRVPERACGLLRNRSIVLSQRTDAWGGRDPICAPWTVGRRTGAFDGPVPGSGPDAASPLAPNAYDVDSLGAFYHVAARDGVVGLSFLDAQMQDEVPRVVRVEAAAFDAGAPGDVTAIPLQDLRRIHVLTFATGPELYATTSSAAFHLARGASSLVSVFGAADAGASEPALAMMGGKPYVAFVPAGAPGDLSVAPFESPTTVGAAVASATVGAQASLPSRITTIEASELVLPNRIELQFASGVLSSGTVAFDTNEHRVGLADAFYVDSTRVGADRLFGFYRLADADGGPPGRVYDYTSDASSVVDELPMQFEYSSTPTPSGFCAVYSGPTALQSVICRSTAELTENRPGTPVLSKVFRASIDADETYMYFANTCALRGPVHVQRVLLADVGKPGAVKNPCP